MRRFLFPALLLIALGCGTEFEPELNGWRAYTLPGQPLVHVEIDGRETMIELPDDENVGYRFAQWTKFHDNMLLARIVKTKICYEYQIISVDTTGAVTDTLYTAPPNKALNFKLAPNDSLLILKTYDDNCTDESDHFRYTFYNRYSKSFLPDTITVGNARGILLPETVWSPDSRKVIIAEWTSGHRTKAFTYDLVTKDTISIDKGSGFKWSPNDKDLVAYIKDYSIYGKNIKTGEAEIIFEGKKKHGATDFRWNPNGDFLMIHVQGYLLNVDFRPFETHKIMYLSMPDKRESRIYFDGQRIDTWK